MTTSDVNPIGPHEIMRKVTFAPLPYDTHPIDTVRGPQGWGPFNGPYSPQDYVPGICAIAGQSGLDIGYRADAFLPDHGPGYSEITVFTDRSPDLVNSVLVHAENNGTQSAVSQYSSTISNALTRARETSGAQNAMATLKSSVLKYLQ